MASDQARKEIERQQLIEQRQQLLADIALLRESLQGEVDVDVDEGDPDVIEREKSVVLLATLEERLASLDDAIKAVDRGTYGICERCGKPIPPERLEVKPEATLCVTCQAEVERLQKRGLTPTRPRFWDFETEQVEEEE